METTGNIGVIWGLLGIIGYILGFYWDNGKENGSYRDYRDNVGDIGFILGEWKRKEKRL